MRINETTITHDGIHHAEEGWDLHDPAGAPDEIIGRQAAQVRAAYANGSYGEGEAPAAVELDLIDKDGVCVASARLENIEMPAADDDDDDESDE